MLDIVLTYIQRYKDDQVVLLGDIATYVWISKYRPELLNTVMPRTIEVHVTSPKPTEIVVDRWSSYLHDYEEVPPISSSTILKSTSGKIPYIIHTYDMKDRDIRTMVVDGITISM
jgi:hypothetical protein